jgi:hypothetical protein
MAANVERFKKDLDRLLNLGDRLDLSMLREVFGDDYLTKQFAPHLNKKQIDALLRDLPTFKSGYEEWYSESPALLRQLLPDRVRDFIGFYERPKGRKDLTNENDVIQDYMKGLTVSYYGETKVETSAAVPQFRQQLAILKAAKRRFESSLFEIKQLAQADVFDSEIDAAREPLKNGFLRPAGVLAGVVLEKHLKQVCVDHSIKLTKQKAGINDLNELLKANSVIDVAQWRYISMLGDLRNLSAHDKKKEPSVDQITDLIDGTVKVLKTIA